jgi:hypothetical protein
MNAVISRIVVRRCAFSRCGRNWPRRDGPEQSYIGDIDDLRHRSA